nr:DUF6760 family protein [Halopiger djelfimassiliensis]
MQRYDPDTLFEEVAFIAYHFGWSHEEVLELPHWERQRWCEEISEINERMNEAAAPDREPDRGEGGSFLDDDGDGIVLQNSLEDL